MMMYRHPPRTRQISLAENIHSLIINKHGSQNKHLKTFEYSEHNKGYDGVLKVMMHEVIKNGYKYDLCLSCSKNSICIHNVFNSKYSILKIVDEKMKCIRHKLMGSPLRRDHMLALIL